MKPRPVQDRAAQIGAGQVRIRLVWLASAPRAPARSPGTLSSSRRRVNCSRSFLWPPLSGSASSSPKRISATGMHDLRHHRCPFHASDHAVPPPWESPDSSPDSCLALLVALIGVRLVVRSGPSDLLICPLSVGPALAVPRSSSCRTNSRPSRLPHRRRRPAVDTAQKLARGEALPAGAQRVARGVHLRIDQPIGVLGEGQQPAHGYRATFRHGRPTAFPSPRLGFHRRRRLHSAPLGWSAIPAATTTRPGRSLLLGNFRTAGFRFALPVGSANRLSPQRRREQRGPRHHLEGALSQGHRRADRGVALDAASAQARPAIDRPALRPRDHRPVREHRAVRAGRGRNRGGACERAARRSPFARTNATPGFTLSALVAALGRLDAAPR